MNPILSIVVAGALLAAGCTKSPATYDPPARDAAPASDAKTSAPPASDVAPAEPPSAPPSKSGAAPCPGVDSALTAWHADQPGRAIAADADGAASVVVTLATDAPPPPALRVTLREASTLYGYVTRAELCAVATAPGVTAVRAAALANTK